ncbi:TPR domain protein, putative component of TonB system [hydrothermal vent metagenome]|uniref:TPR domain protein, putative component of TonB system n=1 Tax=hydrothermal vent metagenome TaxID=652676 RepID=A0A3B1BVT4_9ZZZZ
MYRVSFLTAFIIISAFAFLAPTYAHAGAKPTGPSSKRDYWTANQKMLDEKDSRYALAHSVFDRVLAAADKRPGPIPELIILDEGGYPWARSLPDGAIILTRGAIDICLRSASMMEAKAKLAFIIGHELSHQVNGDFWHFFFYQGVRPEQAKGASAKKTLKEVIEIARKTDSVVAKELKADQYGVIYASQAGYNVSALMKADVNFFYEWAAATSPGLLEGAMFTPAHPRIQQRSATVILTIKQVARKIALFDKGVIYYKQGNYAAAKRYFEDFLSQYQSREAFNNLGLVYYQMALKEHMRLQPHTPVFRLSLIIDPSTRAKETTKGRQALMTPFNRSFKRSDGTSALFRKYSKTAAKYFREAADRDHTYAPAHNNIACVHFLRREFSSAVGQLDISIILDPTNAEAYNNRGVSYLNHAKKLKVNLNSKVESDLKKALKIKPDYVDATFNLAYFYKITGNEKEKRHYMLRLKKIAPRSGLIALLE